jgi:hypothetical protein
MNYYWGIKKIKLKILHLVLLKNKIFYGDSMWHLKTTYSTNMKWGGGDGEVNLLDLTK